MTQTCGWWIYHDRTLLFWCCWHSVCNVMIIVCHIVKICNKCNKISIIIFYTRLIYIYIYLVKINLFIVTFYFRDSESIDFVTDFSDVLLLRLFEVAISSSSANDKVRSSSVRALGNLLRYLPQRAYGNYNTFLYGDAKRSKYLTVYFFFKHIHLAM